MKSFLSTLLCGALIGFTGLYAADAADDSGSAAPAGPGQGRRGAWGGGRMGGRGSWGGGRMGGQRMGMGSMMLNRSTRESEIQQKFPKEYAEIAKQLVDAENKLQELAQKAKVELPVDNNSVFRQLKLKDPAGFAEAEKLMKSRESSREGFEKLQELAKKHGLKLAFGMGNGPRRGAPNAGEGAPQLRRNSVNQMRQIRKKFPEEWEKVTELRQQGKRREAEELLRDLMRRADGAPRAPRGE